MSSSSSHLSTEAKEMGSMHFTLGQERVISRAFDKFIECDDIAVKNNPQPFEKEIISDGLDVGSFHWDFGESSFWDSGATGMFDREDVVCFQDILGRLPAIKEKLAQDIRDKESQRALFK